MKYYKNSKKLEVSDKLQGYLNLFKTIEDFRVLEPEINEMLQGTNKQQSTNKRRHRSLSENEGALANIDNAAQTCSSWQTARGHKYANAGGYSTDNRKRQIETLLIDGIF